jgi:hypothetical protein
MVLKADDRIVSDIREANEIDEASEQISEKNGGQKKPI